jgi:hypothetical protein
MITYDFRPEVATLTKFGTSLEQIIPKLPTG